MALPVSSMKEFDAIRWYSFWKNISYNLAYGAYCNKD
jgi:hypothetical protein